MTNPHPVDDEAPIVVAVGRTIGGILLVVVGVVLALAGAFVYFVTPTTARSGGPSAISTSSARSSADSDWSAPSSGADSSSVPDASACRCSWMPRTVRTCRPR
jgi:hypothetical protein